MKYKEWLGKLDSVAIPQLAEEGISGVRDILYEFQYTHDEVMDSYDRLMSQLGRATLRGLDVSVLEYVKEHLLRMKTDRERLLKEHITKLDAILETAEQRIKDQRTIAFGQLY